MTSDEIYGYWAARLAGAHMEAGFCRDYARPVPFRYEARSVSFQIPAEGVGDDWDMLSFLIAVHQLWLAHYSGVGDVLVGAPGVHRQTVLPIRGEVDLSESFREHLLRVRSLVRADFAHEGISTREVSSLIGIGEQGGGMVPFGLVLRLEDLQQGRPDDGETFDLLIRYRRDGSLLAGTLEFNQALFHAGNIALLVTQLRTLMLSVSSRPTEPMATIPLLDPQDISGMLVAFCRGPEMPCPVDRTLGELFEARASEAPEAVAAVHRGRRVTYGTLEAAADAVADALRVAGVGPGSFVAILAPRSIEFLTGMLAVWKAGGAYVPVDPGYPEERVAYMLNDSRCAVVLVPASLLERYRHHLQASSSLRTVVCLDDGGTLPEGATPTTYRVVAPKVSPRPGSRPPITVGARTPAYMIYTSGSTGRPKGAIVRHDGAVNHIYAQVHALGLDGVYRFLQSAPSSSDISVWQFAAPVVLGGYTTIIDDVTDVESLFAVVRSERVSIIEIVPVVLKYLLAYVRQLPDNARALPDLRWMMVTGESAPLDLVNDWLAVYPGVPVVNAYGPTEAADDITQAVITAQLPANLLSVPIGRPLANLDVYLLDGALQPVPVGMPGEICVAGIGVGEGYWRNPERTAASFVANPVANGRGATVYRTGDRGRWLFDGNLQFLGRIDQQVQVRGFRIELEEIESVLRQHPSIQDVVAVARGQESGEGFLAAFYVPAGGADVDVDALRAFAGKHLANYMVPAAFRDITAIPLTPSGKVDRRALPEVERASDKKQSTAVAARTPCEAALLAIWQTILPGLHFGVEDDFLALGGDSIGAIQVVAMARAAGLRLTPQDVFVYRTVRALGARVDERGSRADHETPVVQPAVEPLTSVEQETLERRYAGADDAYPLSPTQQGIFLECLLSRAKDIYVDQVCYWIRGALDPESFRIAWQQVMNRHTILRTAFVHRGLGRPMQLVMRSVEVPLRVRDCGQLDPNNWTEELGERRRLDLSEGLRLDQAPLMKLTLVRLDAQTHYLIWTHHHLLLDGWSLATVINEVLETYTGILRGSARPLSHARPFSDYIAWLQRQDIGSARESWRGTLDGFRSPARIPRTAGDQAAVGHHTLEEHLGAAETVALESLAKQERVTIGTLVQGAWVLTLARETRASDLTFGTVVSGRDADLEGISEMVGMFINTLPVRVHVHPAEGVRSWLRALQARLADVQQYGYLPLKRINEWSEVPKQASPLFDSLFVMLNYPSNLLLADGCPGISVEVDDLVTVPDSPVTVICAPGRTIRVRLVYDGEAFAAAHARRMLDGLIGTLKELPMRVGGKVGQLVG